MSLCNWLPSPSAATNPQSAAKGSSAHYGPTPHPSGHMHSLQSRQQFQAVPLQHQVPQQQQHSPVSNQLCGEIKQPGCEFRQQPASAYRAAERKRQHCLLEIERELLRHSSDDEAPADHMQLPNCNAGKRRKTSCTGQNFCLEVPSLLATNKKLYPDASKAGMQQQCNSIVKVALYQYCHNCHANDDSVQNLLIWHEQLFLLHSCMHNS